MAAGEEGGDEADGSAGRGQKNNNIVIMLKVNTGSDHPCKSDWPLHSTGRIIRGWPLKSAKPIMLLFLLREGGENKNTQHAFTTTARARVILSGRGKEAPNSRIFPILE